MKKDPIVQAQIKNTKEYQESVDKEDTDEEESSSSEEDYDMGPV